VRAFNAHYSADCPFALYGATFRRANIESPDPLDVRQPRQCGNPHAKEAMATKILTTIPVRSFPDCRITFTAYRHLAEMRTFELRGAVRIRYIGATCQWTNISTIWRQIKGSSMPDRTTSDLDVLTTIIGQVRICEMSAVEYIRALTMATEGLRAKKTTRRNKLLSAVKPAPKYFNAVSRFRLGLASHSAVGSDR
jgi:hypothetical protein